MEKHVLDLVALGFMDVLLPLLGWMALFFLAALVAGILTTVWARGKLQEKNRKTTLATALMIVALGLFAPLFALYMSAAFSVQRSVAGLLRDQGRSIVRWTVEMGVASFEEAMDIKGEDATVNIKTLKDRIEKQREGVSQELPEAGVGDPFTVLGSLPSYARGLFWESVAKSINEYSDGQGNVPWKALRKKAEEGLVKEGHKGFKKAADELDTGAMATLYAFLLVVLLLHGISFVLPLLVSAREKSSPLTPTSP